MGTWKRLVADDVSISAPVITKYNNRQLEPITKGRSTHLNAASARAARILRVVCILNGQ